MDSTCDMTYLADGVTRLARLVAALDLEVISTLVLGLLQDLGDLLVFNAGVVWHGGGDSGEDESGSGELHFGCLSLGRISNYKR